MLICRYVKELISLACLLLLLNISVFADCAVLTLEKAEFYAAQDAANQFYKGLFIGFIIFTFGLNIFILLKQKRFILLTTFVIAVVAIQPLYIIGEIMAHECGNAGASWTYYAYEFVGISVICIAIFLFRRSK